MNDNFIKKVYINNEVFEVNCELGIQDVAWIAMNACNYYGKNSIPIGRYIPILAQNKNKEYLHPKLNVNNYNKLIGDEIYVKIKEQMSNPDTELTEMEKKWTNQAYGKEKFLMDVKFKFLPSVQDFKYNIKNFYVKIKLLPILSIANQEEYKIEEALEYILPQSETSPEIHECKVQLPVGEIQVLKIYYKETQDIIKEITDTVRNKLIIDKFPEPLLPRDKELIIKKKEQSILNKEKELQGIINKIQEDKWIEDQRIKALQLFLESVPYTLDDIYDMTIKLIPNSESDLEPIFKLFHNNEFKFFKLLYSMFEDYSIYYNDEEEYGEFIDVNSVKHCLSTYININRPVEYESIQNTFKYYFIDKRQCNPHFKFNDFMFCLIYTLYFNNNMNSIEMIPDHINYFFENYEKRQNTESYKTYYKDHLVISQFKCNLKFFARLFAEEAKEHIFNHYNEMSINSFSGILHAVAKNNKSYNFIDLWKEVQFDKGINFISFLEGICLMGVNARLEKQEEEAVQKVKEKELANMEDDNDVQEESLENYEKVSLLIDAFKNTFPDYINTEDKIINEDHLGENEDDIGKQDTSKYSTKSLKLQSNKNLLTNREENNIFN